VKVWAVIHERDLAEGLVREELSPLATGCADDPFEAIAELVRVYVRPWSAVRPLQGSSAKLKRERAPSEDKVRLVHDNIVLKEGQRMPDISEQRRQHLFRTTHCKEGVVHYRVLLPNSVDYAMVLVCNVCNNYKALLRLAQEFGHKRSVLRISKEEWKLVQDVNRGEIDGQRRSFLYQVNPWVGVNSYLAGVSVDLLVLDGPPTADPHALRRGLCVFFDGEGHKRTRRRNQKQVDTDRKASTQAAEAGYCVLRIYKSDTNLKLTILDQAWCRRNDEGWVLVSPSWNDGAHRPNLLPPRSSPNK
jgi:hypothetical protein